MTTKTSRKPATITVAFNPMTRRYEIVEPQDEVIGSVRITMYLGGDGKYYTIPE